MGRIAPLLAVSAITFTVGIAAAAPPSPEASSETTDPAAPAAQLTPAPPSDPRIEQAREAFVQGTALGNEGRWPEALEAFERSAALRAHPVTTYNIAYCERTLGHYARAYKLFGDSLTEHQSGSSGTLPEDLVARATQFRGEAERRLARVAIRLEPGGTALSVDDRPLERLSIPGDPHLVLIAGTRDKGGSAQPPSTSFELVIDPGRHLFVLSRPGVANRVVSESFDPGSRREVVLRAEMPPLATPGKVETTAAGPPKSEHDNTWTYVAYGVGGAGLATATVFGILAIVKESFLHDHCPGKSCDPKYQGDIDEGNRDAMITNVGFGVAALGAGIGTYLLLTGGAKEQGGNRRAASIETWIGPRSIGARGRF